MELMLNKNAHFYFVTKTGERLHDPMDQMLAYLKIVEFLEETKNVKWISLTNANSLAPSDLNVFVTNERLSSVKPIVISPGTVLCCKLRKDVDNSNRIFEKLVITTSGLPDVVKKEICRLITENGGTFTGYFNSKETDIVVTNADQANNPKVIVAMKTRKKCLTPEWVTDSVANGKILPYGVYEIGSVSGPTHSEVDEKNVDNQLKTSPPDSAYSSMTEPNDHFARHDELDQLGSSNDGANSREKHSTPKENGKNRLPMESIILFDEKSDQQEQSTQQKQSDQQEPSTQKKQSDEQKQSVLQEPSTQQEQLTEQEPSIQHKLSTQQEQSIQPCHKICLSKTVMDPVERQTMKDQIEKLGGAVCDHSTKFVRDSCTHLVCAQPILSEKTTAIIASGGWLLLPDYIADSFKAGHFLEEKCYEWGNSITQDRRKLVCEKTKKIAMIAYKWRLKLYSKSVADASPAGIFSDFRAILHTNNKDRFRGLLEAGRGVVVDLKEPYAEQKDFQGITHCFIDKRMGNLSNSDKAAMKAAGVHLVTLFYLQALFQEEDLPNVNDYAVN